MFDMGATELLVVGVVALIVVGPERLPRLARTGGRWIGRARRSLVSIKAEIDRELKTEELKDILRQQQLNQPLDKILEPEPPKPKRPPKATPPPSSEP